MTRGGGVWAAHSQVGHQGILRLLYAYLTGIPREEAPLLPIPLHTLVKLTPHVYSCEHACTPRPRKLTRCSHGLIAQPLDRMRRARRLWCTYAHMASGGGGGCVQAPRSA